MMEELPCAMFAKGPAWEGWANDETSTLTIQKGQESASARGNCQEASFVASFVCVFFKTFCTSFVSYDCGALYFLLALIPVLHLDTAGYWFSQVAWTKAGVPSSVCSVFGGRASIIRTAKAPHDCWEAAPQLSFHVLALRVAAESFFQLSNILNQRKYEVFTWKDDCKAGWLKKHSVMCTQFILNIS